MNDQSLIRIVYASRATAGCLGDLAGNLRQILTAAILNNRPKEISGLLIAHRGWFLQALEGAPDRVHGLFEQICKDPRHRDAVMLVEGAIGARAFGPWSMCARQLSPIDAMILGELDKRPTFEPTEFPERVVIGLLRTIASVHREELTEQQGPVVA